MSKKISQCLSQLKSLLDKSFTQHSKTSGENLYSLTLPLDLDVIPQSFNLPRPFLIWGRPDRQHFRIGLGIARQITSSGEDRLQTLQQWFLQQSADWGCEQEETGLSHPGAFCAFAFDGQDKMTGPWKGVANSLILIPELLLEYKKGLYSLSFTCENKCLSKNKWLKNHWLKQTEILLQAILNSQAVTVASEQLLRRSTTIPKENWCEKVELARDAISRGKLKKVVPARHVQVRSAVPFDLSSVFRHLIQQHSTSLIIGMSLEDKTLAAATPETLLALENGTLSCDALGGTEECLADYRKDNLLAHKLLQDAKSRHEHQLIVEHLTTVLAQFSEHLSVADTPSVMPLGQLQHLWTPIKAQCRPGISLFDIASQIHPTPAVAGSPVSAAKNWIKNHENFQRGWYSGSVGWLQSDGNGELAVLLRCAVLSDQTADLYAGAGIVSDSDPHKEWDETELKLKTMLHALGDIDLNGSGKSSAQLDLSTLKSSSRS